MNCQFCHKDLGKPNYHGCPAPIILACNNCPCEVTYYFYTEGIGSQFKEHVYLIEWQCMWKKQLHIISLNLVRNDFTLLKSQDFDKTILSLNHIPNITPTNMQEKLKLYLLFS